MATPIKVTILGDAKPLVGALGKAQTKLKAFGLASNKTKLLAGGGAVAIAGIGIAALKMGVDLEQSKRDFGVATGLMGDDAEEAFKRVTAAAGKVPDSIDSVIEAGGNLITTTGLVGEDIENLTMQFLDLNRLGFGALSENQVGEFMKAWALDAEGVEDSLDKMAEVSQATGVDLTLLTDLATSNSGALKKMGLSNAEAIEMIGQWEKAGIDTNKVVRGLNSNIDMLTDQGFDASAMLAKFNTSMDDGVISAEEALLGYELFGAEFTDVQGALEAGTISLGDFGAQMGLSGQSVQDMTDASQSVGERFSEMKNKMLVQLVPALIVMAEKFIDFMDWVLINFPKGWAIVKEFADKVVVFFQDIWVHVAPIFDALREVFSGYFEYIMGIWNTFKALFQGDWEGVWDGVKQVFSGAWTALKGLFKVGWTVFKAFVKLELAALKKLFWNKLKDIGGLFKRLPGTLKTLVGRGAGKLKQVGIDIVKWILEGIGSMGNAIFDATIGKIPGAGAVTGAVGKVGGFLGLAHGGPVPGGKNVLVGERGPEMLKIPNSLGGASVVSNKEMAGAGASGGGAVTVNVYGSDATPEAIGAAVAWKIRRAG